MVQCDQHEDCVVLFRRYAIHPDTGMPIYPKKGRVLAIHIKAGEAIRSKPRRSK